MSVSPTSLVRSSSLRIGRRDSFTSMSTMGLHPTSWDIDTDDEEENRFLSEDEGSDIHSKINLSLAMSHISERVVLNIGGVRFETCTSTLLRYPESLLGVMFHERNTSMRKADAKGEYFFDRSPLAFEAILNFYRMGRLFPPSNVCRKMMEIEVDFWQLPPECLRREEQLGTRFSSIAMKAVRKRAQPTLGMIKDHIVQRIGMAAVEGLQSFIIEFKETSQPFSSNSSVSSRPGSPENYSIRTPEESAAEEFYSFLSNFSNRELLLRDLMEKGLDVSFNDMTSVIGHSYILSITLWDRFTKERTSDQESAALLCQVLNEMRQGVEVKTLRDDHILNVKPLTFGG
eukprot:TRINITY_DN6691_c0_g1_i1.p1 TRINITY_DN6691_c0_g1~~TRINITY_DN6691_c0_g1_i1.p1  ORF type:complete len:344 (-),score=119.09 TRINITY_DN6691_c0_g1_i1:412-1443(-)